MWRWISGIPRAIRQQYGSRASASICKDEDLESCKTEESRHHTLRECFWSHAHRRSSHYSCSSRAKSEAAGQDNKEHVKDDNEQWAKQEAKQEGDKAQGPGREKAKQEGDKAQGPGREKAKNSPDFLSFFHSSDLFKWGTAVVIGLHIWKLPLWINQIEKDNKRKYQRPRSPCLAYRVACAPSQDVLTKKSILSTDKKLHIDTGQNLQLDSGQFETESRRPSLISQLPAVEITEQQEDPLDKVVAEFQSACNNQIAVTKNIAALVNARKGRIKEAVNDWAEASELGYAKAHYNLAVCYETGKGLRKNMKQAVKHYKLAAEEDHPQALYNLAILYINGDGLKQNQSEGISLMEKAAKLGHAQANTYLGVYYTGDLENDMDKAASYFKTAAEQNDVEAEYFLGICYEQGWGVEENKCKAASLYAQAASEGHDGAMYNLGVFHLLGLGGLPEDKVSALELFKKAAEAGNESAIEFLEEPKESADARPWREMYMYDFVQEPESEQTEEVEISQMTPPPSPNQQLKSSYSVSMPSLTDFVRQHIEELQLGMRNNNDPIFLFTPSPVENMEDSPLFSKSKFTEWNHELSNQKISVPSTNVSKVSFSLGGNEDDIDNNLTLSDETYMDCPRLDHHFSSLVIQRHSTMPNMQLVSW